MTKVLYPGSFDPITLGHMNIIKQASDIFDEVIVAIMQNPDKINKGFFTVEERLAIINEIYKDNDNVKVISSSGATINVARENDCKIIVRGLRNIIDFAQEYSLQQINKEISNNEIRTVCLFADKDYQDISSSMVKELYRLDIDYSKYVSSIVEEKMKIKKLGGK
jgi:pantetheine-phosphate adenylyltransferase